MADYYVYDRNGRLSGYHKHPDVAVTHAKQLAQRTGGFADVEKRQGGRRRYFASGRVATIRKREGGQMSGRPRREEGKL